jgi:hypothetical protein
LISADRQVAAGRIEFHSMNPSLKGSLPRCVAECICWGTEIKEARLLCLVRELEAGVFLLSAGRFAYPIRTGLFLL